MSSNFPLEQWFDTSNKIDRYDQGLIEDEIRLNAYKDGLGLDSEELRETLFALRNSVRLHNLKFQNPTRPG